LGREAYFARGVERVAGHEDSPSEARGNRPYLEALLDPDVPLGPIALLLLAAGLTAKFPEESGLATEALIAAVDDGRLDSARLTAALEQLLSVGLAKPERLARTLGAANVSILHTQFLCPVLERLAHRPPSRTHREMLPVLELFKELLIAAGESIGHAASRDYLTGLSVAGKTGRVVQALLTLTEDPTHGQRRAAAAQALARRLERAERWASWEAASV
jgi:hypothetical protein